MDLNKLLCKYLAREGKGCVTIGDGVSAAGKMAFLLFFVAIYIQGTIFSIEAYNTGVCMDENWTIFEAVCSAFHLTGTMLVVCVVAATIAHLAIKCIVVVCATKIAACERKDGD